MSFEKKILNLTQSVEIHINTNLKIGDLSTNKDFQENLYTELESKNLEIDSNHLSPKFIPQLNDNDSTKDLISITYQVKTDKCTQGMMHDLSHINKQLQGVGICYGQTVRNVGIGEQLEKIIKNSVQEEIKVISDKFDRLFKVTECPKVIRQLVKELRIYEINNRYKEVNLSKENDH